MSAIERFAYWDAMCIMDARPAGSIEKGYRLERRLHTRHRARTTVYVVMSGRKSRICKAKNLSANGVFVETENLGLRKGQQVQLAFAINLGLVTKIHRRTAIVAHVTRGGTGLMMEQFAGR
jgi:hypothetical protein